MRKTRILFLCTGNACRSQMAEGWARHLRSEVIEAHSAGTAPAKLSRRAVRVMAEAGVDISGQRSKHVGELLDLPLDYVVVVCSKAAESCPVFPGNVKTVRAPFDDPAAARETGEEVLEVFRRVRDEIRDFARKLPGSLEREE